MKYSFDGFNYWLRLDKGEKLQENLQKFMNATGIKGGWVNGIGAALQGELGYYNLKKQEYQWHQFNDMKEVLSLQGNLTKNESGKYHSHLHGVFGDEKYGTIGGHVKDLTVGGTLEMFVHSSFIDLKRNKNEKVGLEIWDLDYY
jgi:predicted DNA-binding protein with PD1-like motif